MFYKNIYLLIDEKTQKNPKFEQKREPLNQKN